MSLGFDLGIWGLGLDYRIEAVQRRAAGFCFRRYKRKSSPTLMQANLGWSLLSA